MTTPQFDLDRWMRERQLQDVFSPAEWVAARIATLDQLESLDAAAPLIVHRQGLFSSPWPGCPWFLGGEREKLDREQFRVLFFRKDKIGEPRNLIDSAFVCWRDGELELAPRSAHRKFGPGWRIAVMAAHLVDPNEAQQ